MDSLDPTQDIRWLQRFHSYKKALAQLKSNVSLANSRPLTKIEIEGLIKSFEYTYELSWNVIKDFYAAQGEVNIQGSRDAFSLAFNRGLIQNGSSFINMIKSRQLTSRAYNEATAKMIYDAIIEEFFDAFIQLEEVLNKRAYSIESNII